VITFHFRVPGSDRFSYEHSALICGVSTSPFSLSLHLAPWLQAGFLINPPQVIQRIFLIAAGFLFGPLQDIRRTLMLLDLLFTATPLSTCFFSHHSNLFFSRDNDGYGSSIVPIRSPQDTGDVSHIRSPKRVEVTSPIPVISDREEESDNSSEVSVPVRRSSRLRNIFPVDYRATKPRCAS